MPRKQFRESVRLLKDALEEVLGDEPNEKRVRRKLREAALVCLDLEIESQVDDRAQAGAVKLLRENVIRKAEKEKLADEAAELGLERWKTLTDDQLEELVDDDEGMLSVALERTELRISGDDEALSSALIKAGNMLSRPFVEAISAEELDSLVAGAIKVCDLALAGKPAVEQMQRTATEALTAVGAIRAMRKSFAGLLIGDLILRQVGKSLGIKDKISVTDFIIFLACGIVDKQVLPKVDRDELLKVREELAAI